MARGVSNTNELLAGKEGLSEEENRIAADAVTALESMENGDGSWPIVQFGGDQVEGPPVKADPFKLCEMDWRESKLLVPEPRVKEGPLQDLSTVPQRTEHDDSVEKILMDREDRIQPLEDLLRAAGAMARGGAAAGAAALPPAAAAAGAVARPPASSPTGDQETLQARNTAASPAAGGAPPPPPPPRAVPAPPPPATPVAGAAAGFAEEANRGTEGPGTGQLQRRTGQMRRREQRTLAQRATEVGGEAIPAEEDHDGAQPSKRPRTTS